jgi:polar amino acid transport system substrate-binding protein
MMGALSMLIADGTVTNISRKWLDSDPVSLEGNAEALSKKDLKGPEKRTVIIGVDENSYPLAFRQDNSYGGFNVELAQAVCDKLGWKATFLSIEPANTFIELSSGDVDVAWNMPMDSDSKDFPITVRSCPTVSSLSVSPVPADGSAGILW